MELKVFLLADYANIGNDKLNILGVIDTITSISFPLKIPSMHLAIKLTTEQVEHDVEHKIQVPFLDENETEIAKGEGNFTVPGSNSEQIYKIELNFAIAIRDLVFERPSQHKVRLLIDDCLMGTIPLEVIQLERSQQAD